MASYSTANALLNALHGALEGSSFRPSSAASTWLQVNDAFNVRIQRGWRQYPESCYLILFKGDGQNYILELDTALIIRAKGTYDWSLNRPSNVQTLKALIATLGPMSKREQGYRDRVRAEREDRGQPVKVDRNGYPLAVNSSFDSTVQSLLTLLAAVAKAHGGSWPSTSGTSTTPLPQLSDLESDLESRLSKAKKDSSDKRRARLALASKKPVKRTVLTTAFIRNEDVIAEVLFRADGRCEMCEAAAPFHRKKDGEPYLEVHHRIQLSQGGDDSVGNAIATCPNCHRHAHYG